MAQNKTNLTLVTDSTHFPPLNICDINAISLYGELTQLKAETKKLKAEKVKIEEILKEYATEKVKTNQLLEEVRAMLHAKSPECGKNCSLANRDCQSQNTIKQSKADTPQQAKKTYAECASKQPDTSIKPTCNPAPAKGHIFSTAGKKQQTGANTTKPCSTSTGMDSQKKEHDSEWTTVSNKKAKHRTGKGDSGTLKAAQKPVVLFISRVDPDTTKEEVENFANIHFQKTEIHCEKLKTRYNFYASFKVTLQGVEMEDALSSHIWPSGILVKKFFYGRTLSHKKGWNNQHPTTVNNGSKN